MSVQDEILEYVRDNPGLFVEDIAKGTGFGFRSAQAALYRLKENGLVTMESIRTPGRGGHGKAKYFVATETKYFSAYEYPSWLEMRA